jgi:hypothetical protein
MKRDLLKFLPLLLLYILLVLIFSSPAFQGDENGYVSYASHLVQPAQASNWNDLWWGPGYPIVLAPFALFNIPWLAAKLLNAFFLFGAVLYFYNSLCLYFEKKYAAIFTFIFGLYPPLFRELPQLLTESLVFFLVCGFTYHFCKTFQETRQSRLHILAASIFLATLALTKVFFGYVILAGLLSFLLLFLWRRKNDVRNSIFIYSLALALCLPYLFYTYNLTGKFFYWGSSGGESLYWMTTNSSPDELGSWYSGAMVADYPELAPYRDFFANLNGLSVFEQDAALKKQSIANLTHHPLTYLKNWAANVGRLVFEYPFSFTYQKMSTYFYILPNMFIVVALILSIYPAMRGRRIIPYELAAILLFMLITFGGSSLLSAFNRQFHPVVPGLILWIAFVFTRILKIEIRTDPQQDDEKPKPV